MKHTVYNWLRSESTDKSHAPGYITKDGFIRNLFKTNDIILRINCICKI